MVSELFAETIYTYLVCTLGAVEEDRTPFVLGFAAAEREFEFLLRLRGLDYGARLWATPGKIELVPSGPIPYSRSTAHAIAVNKVQSELQQLDWW